MPVRRSPDDFEADLARLLGDDYVRRPWLTFQNIATTFTAFCGGVLLVYQLGGKAEWNNQTHAHTSQAVERTSAEVDKIDGRVRHLESQRISREEFNDLKADVRAIREFLMYGRWPEGVRR